MGTTGSWTTFWRATLTGGESENSYTCSVYTLMCLHAPAACVSSMSGAHEQGMNERFVYMYTWQLPLSRDLGAYVDRAMGKGYLQQAMLPPKFTSGHVLQLLSTNRRYDMAKLQKIVVYLRKSETSIE